MELREFKIQVIPLKDKLYRLAKRLLEDTDEAQDIVQEVFIRLWKKGESLREYRSIEALAMVTTRNLCLDRLRMRKYPTENIDEIRGEVETSGIDERIDHSEIVAKIHSAINTLPELQRTVIHLRDIEGYEYREIADLLDMNENAVRVNLSRARKRIRETLINRKLYEYERN